MDETFEILQEHFDTVMVPDILHSDNGPQFRNKLITRFAEVERFAHICGASDTPQHQGQVESFNKTIKKKAVHLDGREPADIRGHVACQRLKKSH